MEKNFKFGIIILLISCITSCKKNNPDFKFYSCEFDQSQYNNPIYYSKWIDNKEDALKTKLTFVDSNLNERNLDSLYKETAQHLFIIGGGGMYVPVENCSVEIKNDTIQINFNGNHIHEPVGEAASSFVCLEINRKKYPNYKNMKVTYIDTDL
ncbi:hypothetical protein DBB36_22485 [Flavobacterium sp. WLB]|uniref:Uncharacterized protein n=1 Tax=Flavobacterium panici TaxID=2654843 RepID=A0A9N8J8L0_9FLAO|nr:MULTISPECIES: hypothetical protein [Flavobacterium]KOP39037.1 hypothetical protein AKO67_05620 [Flavobacterium sp. VMW]OWU89308.1 hypothetical protein APR43_19130 [Flavobacterium sp. NLM]PUU67733.1 hypothetical protein DBB36_22485 [Flavobacterium sp. WLB]CAC9976813.1 hypothetical protein FLAPXU55_04541 [Flavobacterium panici]